MDTIILRFLNAMHDIEVAASEMDAAFTQTRATHTRHDKALNQLQKLLSEAGDSFDSKTHDRLKTLSAKYAAQHRLLERHMDAFATTQERYSDVKSTFDDLFASQQWALAEHGAADLRRQEREAGMMRMVENTIRDLSAAYQGDDGSVFAHPDTSTSYIPLPVDEYLTLLIALNRLLMADADYAVPDAPYRPVSFLEVGCGHGRLMFLTKQSGLLRCSSIEGFDFNPQLVSLGREALMLGDAIVEGEAMTFNYSGHDVIYSFRPFRDNEMQADFEARLVRQMQPSAYLISPSALDLARHPELRRMSDHLPIWKKARPS